MTKALAMYVECRVRDQFSCRPSAPSSTKFQRKYRCDHVESTFPLKYGRRAAYMVTNLKQLINACHHTV